MKIVKQLLKRGAICVILNATLPISKLELRLKCAGLNLSKAGEEGKVYVIDLFESKYELSSEKPYILQIPNWSDKTGIAKLINLYHELGDRIPKGTLVVGLVATLEGLYHEFSYQMMQRIIRASLASFEKEPLNSLKISVISLLNEEAIPEHAVAWLFSLHDQVVEFVSQVTPLGLEEIILVPKSVLPEFMPRHFKIKLSREQVIQLF